MRYARALLAPSLESGPVHAVAAASYPLSPLPARTSPPIIYTPPFRLRQNAVNVSARNKKVIRCAWVGTADSDFNAQIGSEFWPSAGSCPGA